MIGVDFKVIEDMSGLKRVVKSVNAAHQRQIRFGWIDKKKYPSNHRSRGLYVAQVAFWQEYGTSKFSARPYFRQLINKVKREFHSDIVSYYQQAINGHVNDQLLQTMANEINYKFHSHVSRQVNKPLSDTTIRIKGHDFQLDDSGLLLNSFNAKVFKQNFENIKLKSVNIKDYNDYWNAIRNRR